MSVARGQFSHSLLDDLVFLWSTVFSKRNKQNQIRDFESRFASYVGRKQSIAFPLARTALYCALSVLPRKTGDKILMPSITIKAMLDVVIALGLKPIFVDCDRQSGSFDLDSLEKALHEEDNIKYCLLTYLFGMMPDSNSILAKLRSKEIFVIEDFSQNLNAKMEEKRAGQFGDLSLYSTSALKVIDTHGGGFLFGDDDDLMEQIRRKSGELKESSKRRLFKKGLLCLVKNILTKKFIFSLFTFPILKIVNSFKPDTFSRFVGERDQNPLDKLPEDWFVSYNSAQASLGIKLIDKAKFNDDSRLKIAQEYSQAFSGFPRVKGFEGASSVYWQYIVLPQDPKLFRKSLMKNQIDSAQSSLILISDLPHYAYRKSENINAKFLYEHAVYIPIYQSMKSSDVKLVVRAVKQYLESIPEK